MNAGEIEDDISKLAEAPFDAEAFPYQFLEAFGVNAAALAKLRAGRDNKSDVPGGVLQRAKNNIHLKTCQSGEVEATLKALRSSEATKKLKAKYVLATDGQTVAAERLRDGGTFACDFKDLPNHFGILLDLAGISTTPQIDENPVDIRATNKLNKLYVELLRHNPDWGTDARRQNLNHFFARLIFCFFAEDTNIFPSIQLFTDTLEKYTDRTGANVHEILAELFRAMDIRPKDRAESDLRPFSLKFPYVNGNLFGENTDTPRFTQAARIYLLAIGSLDWKRINPDIFGSMIQAVADDEERGALGMHYTSVPNILKVLNPLFLDDLRAKLAEAGDSPQKLLNLRKRLARIRVFDPACGSGNFLVIAYKEMRLIEAIINERRGEKGIKSAIPISNFRGIELRHFPSEIARLALIIAEFQCDVLYRSELLACKDFLPLKKENWIVHGNALRLDWLQICPQTGTGVKIENSDGRLFPEKLEQAEIDFENAGGETYICGNPPYLGSKWQTPEHKADLEAVFSARTSGWRSLDYVAGWFLKVVDYGKHTNMVAALVATNSICQGVQVPILWPVIYESGHRISFAHTSFKWSNLASHNAGVTVVIVGLSNHHQGIRHIYSLDDNEKTVVRETININAYLAPGRDLDIKPARTSISGTAYMDLGNMPKDGGNLLFSFEEAESASTLEPPIKALIYDFVGSQEYVKGIVRRCLWIEDNQLDDAMKSGIIRGRLEAVRKMRLESDAESTRDFANRPHRFKQIQGRGRTSSIVVPKVTSEERPYLPVGLLSAHSIVSDNAYALYDAPLWNMALIASRLHLVWIATVTGKLETRYRYSNTLGWNTFPVPKLIEQNKADLTRCAENILLAREAHFPATIADMYDPERMDKEFPDLRAAHERNDETLERIYIGRRFRNDTERLEKLFAMYTEMTGKQASAAASGGKKSPRRK